MSLNVFIYVEPQEEHGTQVKPNDSRDGVVSQPGIEHGHTQADKWMELENTILVR